MSNKTHFCPNHHVKYVDSPWCGTCEAYEVFETFEHTIRVPIQIKFLQSFRVYQLEPSRRHVMTRFEVEERYFTHDPRYFTHDPKYVSKDRAFFALDEYVKPLASAARAGNSTFAIVCFLLRYFTSDAGVVAYVKHLTYMENLRIKL